MSLELDPWELKQRFLCLKKKKKVCSIYGIVVERSRGQVHNINKCLEFPCISVIYRINTIDTISNKPHSNHCAVDREKNKIQFLSLDDLEYYKQGVG